MKFSEITGQKDLKSRLMTLSREGKMSHAMIFCERDGYGALPLALAFVQYNSCPNRTDEDSCGSCPTCNKFSKLIHPDLHFSLPVNTTKRISTDKKPVTDSFIDSWRNAFIKDPYIDEQDWYDVIEVENKLGMIGVNEANLIIKKLNLRSFEGGDKYLIMWLPERMNQEAANKLLKLVEEPPEGTYLLLISQAPERIVPTIVSRCQIFEVPPVEKEMLAEKLSCEYSIDKEEAVFWAGISGGSISAARKLITGEKEGEENYDLVEKLLEGSLSGDLIKVMETCEKIASLGRERQKEFCECSLEFLRRVYMISLDLASISNTPAAQKTIAGQWASRIKPSFYKKSYDAFTHALSDIERNVNPKFIFTDLSNRFFLSLQ